MRGWINLLFCVIIFTSAGFVAWDEMLVPGNVVGQQTGMFSQQDSPLAKTPLSSIPYVKWDFMVLTDPTKPLNKPLGVVEVVLFHHTMKNEIGIYDNIIKGTEYCCTESLHASGVCDNVNQLFIKNLTYALTYKKGFFYYNHLHSHQFTSGMARLNETYSISNTGMWYFIVANCDESSTQSNIKLAGSMEWKNPYGYLPGQIATKLPVYWTLSVLWFILMLAYIILCVLYSKNLMGLQYAILAVISISLVEQFIWSGGLVFYNFNGWSNVATISVGAFFTALKMTAIRCLLLLVGLGLSITRLSLSGGVIAGIVLITTAYFGFRVVYEYGSVSLSSGHVAPSLFAVFGVGLGLVLTNIIFWTWIVLSTYVTMTQLEEKKQTEKAAQYQKLGILLLFALSLSAVILLIQGGVSTLKYSDEYFQWWWTLDAYWQFVYFACVLAVAMIWRPNPNNSAYAYSTQVSQDDDTEGLNPDQRQDDLPVDDNDDDMLQRTPEKPKKQMDQQQQDQDNDQDTNQVQLDDLTKSGDDSDQHSFSS